MFDHLGGFHQHHDHSLPTVTHILTSLNTHIGAKLDFGVNVAKSQISRSELALSDRLVFAESII
jgi:nicotinamidase/pyrazinamidase